MKNIYYFFLATFLLSFSLNSQTHQVVSASGGDASGIGGSAAYSVGQIVYTTNTGTTGSVAQGVEIAYEIYVGIKETDLTISLSVFPNPTSDILTISVHDYKNEELQYALYDEQGRLLRTEQISSEQTQITMNSFPRAVYFLNILEANKKIQTFKIIKN